MLTGCDEDTSVTTQEDTDDDGDGSDPSKPKKSKKDDMENGTVEQDDSVFYAIAVTPGAKNVVSLTGITGDPDLFVYTDAEFTDEVSCSPNHRGKADSAPEDCTFMASSDTIYAEVFGVDPDTSEFTIRASGLSPGAASNEGSIGSPVGVSANSVRHSTVAAPPSGVSYYTTSGLSGRTVVSITGLKKNANLTLSVDDDSGYGSPYSCAYVGLSSDSPEDCIVDSPASTIFIRVENEQAGGGFALAVEN